MRAFPTIGEELGGYRVEALIGRGGMSVVYLAEQLALGRKVALKLLSPDLSEDEDFRQRFVRESRLAGGLEHPNIIPVHEAGDADGLLFIAMRYVQGRDLKALIEREGAMSIDRTFELLSQAASALDAAHVRGLVHRDVKPGNLLVASGEGPEEAEHIYLSDFGLTKKADSKSRMTATGGFVGTLDYVAPEQIQGQDVSGQTDLYSLACVAYECLSGVVPFDRNSEVAVMYAHLQDPPPKLSETVPAIPQAVDGVMAKAMAKEPSERYESCREFMRALRDAGQETVMQPVVVEPAPEPVLTPEPVAPLEPAAPEPSEITKPTETPKRVDTDKKKAPPRRMDRRLIALLALVPVVAAVAFFMTRGGDDPNGANNDDPSSTSENDAAAEAAGGLGGDAGASFAVGRLAFLKETSAGSRDFEVAVADPPDATPRVVPGTFGFDWKNRRPDWAPNDEFFAFGQPGASDEMDIVLLDPENPSESKGVNDSPGPQGSVAVSPDGDKIAYSGTVDTGNLDIFVWDVSSGRTTRLTTTFGIDDSPEWSSDGRTIIYEKLGEGGNDIWVMDADGGNPRQVSNTPGVNEKIPEFNPADETLILYHAQESDGDFGIYVRDITTPASEPGVAIIDTDANEMRASWSPDGNFIAYDSDTNGNLDVYVIPFSGLDDPPSPEDAIQLTDGEEDEQSPAWGPPTI